MKYFVISDIHGSSFYLKKAMDRFEKENADFILILGDILYHGARNDLPEGYNPKEVIEILNRKAEIIMAVRGNCESEVDQMVLDFPVNTVYSNMVIGGKRLFITHGHIYNQKNTVKMPDNSCFLSGHTHILRAERIDGIHYLNPGSVSIPKNNNPHSYAILEDHKFTVKTLDGDIILEHKIV